jgi:dipeptidyl aminopeptidase/acylaminoacyl peptidase
MSDKEIKPYGSWKSPIQAEDLVKEAVGFTQLVTNDDDIYWVESRPNEGNRHVVVKYNLDDKTTEDITSKGFNARTLIYSYGGGALTISNGVAYFTNYSTLVSANDQRIFRQVPGYEPVPITSLAKKSYGDGIIYKNGEEERLICVAEDNTLGGESLLSIISVDTLGQKQTVTLVSDQEPSPKNYYYSSPCLSPDKKYLAWIRWSIPHMPWDNSELWLGEFDDDGLLIPSTQHRLTSDSNVPVREGESIFQPQWAPDGKSLYFVSDRNSGWWNLYFYVLNTQKIEPVLTQAKEVEFGVPQWHLGSSTYAFLSDDQIVCTYTTKGLWYLATIDLDIGDFQPIEINEKPFGKVTDISHIQAIQGKVVFVAGGPKLPRCILLLDPMTGRVKRLSAASKINDDIQKNLSKYQPINFPTGDEGQKAYAFYYPPNNERFEGPKDELPPLLIKMHGGPTAATSTLLNLEIQYFTSRGFGVVDVNYRGSTGYGRAYRLALYEQWGIYDRDDCVNAAKYLADRNNEFLEKNKLQPIDIERVVARGTSAGGYLTLVLAAYTNLLKAGASTAGISNLLLLYAGTHKFEKYYIEQLLGSPPPGEQQDPAKQDYIKHYELRSPYYVSELFNSPMIFFQGTEDPVVPKNQTEVIVEKLRQKGVPVACMLFPGEQHGLRIDKNIIQALEAEFYFYSQMLDFIPADKLKPVSICNWQDSSGGSSEEGACCVTK